MAMMLLSGIMTSNTFKRKQTNSYSLVCALWNKADRLKEWAENGDTFHPKELLLDDRDDIAFMFDDNCQTIRGIE